MSRTDQILNTKQIVVIGDGACGKTSLLMVYINNEFPHEYVPTVFDNYHKEITIDNQTISTLLVDTSGQEDYERLRTLQYFNANIFIVCYAIDCRTSFNNIRSVWMKEIQPLHLPFILVATKLDLRRQIGGCIERQEGERLAKKIKAECFVECSAKENFGVFQVFEAAARASLQIKKMPKKCHLL